MNIKETINDTYGAKYFHKTANAVVVSNENDLYYYTSYIGEHTISIAKGDCVFFLGTEKRQAYVTKGPIEVHSKYTATVIRGYMPDNRSCDITPAMHLPYINGCSAKQIFSPVRQGDPTLQMLHIPAFTSEQAHHVHSTVRVVYVLSGRGKSVVGMEKNHFIHTLEEGMIVIFEAMCPHHFETEDESLTLLPLHIFSSMGLQEYNHPMFNGTYKIKQD